MIGNSLKSDVLPLIEIGAHAIHIPFHTTWAYEMVEHNGEGYKTINHLTDVLKLL
jgi:putative hydrolase of the HAD superfamily